VTLTAPPPVVISEQDAQALFREARRRRRRRWAVSGVALVLVAAGVFSYRSVTSSGAPSGRPSGTTSQPFPVAAGVFAGTWHVKYYFVRISSDGRGSATWPIKTICGQSAQSDGSACDAMNPTTGVISDGGHAQFRLDSVTGHTAKATISGSTESTVLPNGYVVLAYSNSDVLYITPATATSSSPFGRSTFCGASAAKLSFTKQQTEHIDCGT
jgi:hypothetical protein